MSAKLPTKAEVRDAALKHHRMIKADLPPGVGYLSFLYAPATGHIVYTASMPRDVCLKMLRSWLAAEERGLAGADVVVAPPATPGVKS